jgi:hypothetical protein
MIPFTVHSHKAGNYRTKWGFQSRFIRAYIFFIFMHFFLELSINYKGYIIIIVKTNEVKTKELSHQSTEPLQK